MSSPVNSHVMIQQKSHLAVKLSGCNVLVAGTGFEPVTFGL